jgi:radical SAM superfamily enzyme YgiQ (UPF0313 family)
MRLTLIHPCIGRRVGQSYIRSWQMEPLPPAVLAGLTPADVDIRFFDDRMEPIAYDAPTDLVAISIETYTARRAYQIASEYRRRGVPVVMGGFHATLCPDEVARWADAVVVGEAEQTWPALLDDFRSGRLQRFYKSGARPKLTGLRVDRRIFKGKRYLPIGLVEAGRGCHFACDFCAIASYFGSTQQRRPADDVIREIADLRKEKSLFFFVDDNLTSNPRQAKDFYRELVSLRIRWVGQASINLAHDEEFLDILVRSGCQGVLIGFESLNPRALAAMNKDFNTMRGGYDVALANLRRHGLRLYPTFVFGYDEDTLAVFDETLRFAQEHRFYIAAFNHLTPFPGTPLYERLRVQGRLRFEAWWNDDAYRYNQIPFMPLHMTPAQLEQGCVKARARFYSWSSIARRSVDGVNAGNLAMWRNFFLINAMLRAEVSQRNGWPLGDESWRGQMLEAA